jgi:pseudaminic acid cytidylyltransferase
MNICIIPARGGSKRIPRKNIKKFNGKPIIAYSIETAIKSNCFNKIIVSTDDEEISSVASDYGADVPFMRPAELSDDYTAPTHVIAHAIEFFKNQGADIDLVCCIFATAPFVQSSDIKNSLQQIKHTKADYCFSVTSYPFPIQRSIRITKENRCEMFHPEMFNMRSQDLEEAYHDAGQFYWGKPEAWLQKKSLFTNLSCPYILPRCLVQDIDTAEDWIRAEVMYEVLLQRDFLK